MDNVLQKILNDVELNSIAPQADRGPIGSNLESFAFTGGAAANHLDPIDKIELQCERLCVKVGLDHIIDFAPDPIDIVNRVHDNIHGVGSNIGQANRSAFD
jgi:hypothetical protein